MVEDCRRERRQAEVAQAVARQEAAQQAQARWEETCQQEALLWRCQEARLQDHPQDRLQNHQEARQEVHWVVQEVQAAVAALHLLHLQQQPDKQVRFLLATGR